MIAKEFFHLGEGYVLSLIIIGFYLLFISVINSVRYSNKNQNVDTKMLFIYSYFFIQIGFVIIAIFYPFVLTLFGNYFFTVGSTWLSACLLLVIFYLITKRLMLKFSSIVEARDTKTVINHENKKYIKNYYILSTIWLVIMLGLLVTYSIISVMFTDLFVWNNLTNVWIFGSIILMFGVFGLLINHTLNTIKKDEETEKNHVENCPNIHKDDVKNVKINTDLENKKTK